MDSGNRPSAAVHYGPLSGLGIRRLKLQTGTLRLGTKLAGATASRMMKLFNGIGVTLVIAIGTYLTGVNILHPWQGLRLTASSDLEFWIAVILTALVTAVCILRLVTGSEADAELRRFGDALGGPDDLG